MLDLSIKEDNNMALSDVKKEILKYLKNPNNYPEPHIKYFYDYQVRAIRIKKSRHLYWAVEAKEAIQYLRGFCKSQKRLEEKQRQKDFEK